MKAFRDTWKDGIHSCLTCLRDRMTVARELLTESGSIFVQIGDENVHRVRALMDEVFGAENFITLLFVAKTSGFGDTTTIGNVGDYIAWYARSRTFVKYRPIYFNKDEQSELSRDYKYRSDFLTGRPAAVTSTSEHIKLATFSSTASQGETSSGAFVVQHWVSLSSATPASIGELVMQSLNVSSGLPAFTKEQIHFGMFVFWTTTAFPC